MAGITLEQAQEEVDAWYACKLAISKNQEYRIGHRTYIRANLGEVLKAYNQAVGQLNRIATGGRRVRLVSPLG